MREREGALQQLAGLLPDPDGSGHVALISGEAGIGKSVLTSEFARRAAAHATVLSGACDPLTTPRALGPLHDIGRHAGGVLARSLADGERREVVFAALLDQLDDHGRRPPTVLIVEDAHWADEATLDMLTFLGRRITQTRALLVVTFRDDEVGSGHALAAALSTIPRTATTRIPLAPLSPRAVAAMATGSGLDPVEVFDTTGGNPLLVAEVLAATTPGVPPTVRDLMLARLEALPAAARRIAQLVSVVPGRVDAELTAHALEEIDACLEGGVLVAAGDGVAYRHELLRRAVADSLSPVRRAQLHATVLGVLSTTSTDPARLAHHAAGAGDVSALLRHAPAAATRATAVGAHREAIEHLRAVLPRADRLSPAERAEILHSFAVQAYLTGAYDEGLPVAKQALTLWEQLDQPERIGDILSWLGLLNWWTGHPAEADAAYRRSVEVLETLPESSQLAMAYSYQAMRHFAFDETDDAIAWGHKALALADRLGDAKVAAHARVTIASAKVMHRGGDYGQLETIYQDAVRSDLTEESMMALCYAASTAIEHADFVRAAAAVERALAFCQDHDLLSTAQYLLGERSRIRLEQGDWTAAADDAVRALDWPSAPGITQMPALVTLGRLRALRGDAQALTLLDEAATFAFRSGELAWIVPTAIARSEYFWLEGDFPQAAQEVLRWIPLATQRRHRWWLSALAFRLWKADPAAELPPELDLPHRLLLEGDAAAAAAEWERRGCLHSRIEVLACGAAEAATEALRISDALGATRLGVRWRDELRRRGIRVTRGRGRATVSNPAGLTARQLEVITLMAEGLTNPQIGERLSMSPRTAGHHVSAVLDKLNANTRSQATATALRLGLLD
ncbi:ATP-binding protein [Pseudonocardia sp. GCM10023141]|uniref:ATP-binding protein n=1 Tax=Pseudonocardia sp. GCM10023141 TaxID=3252653 RepID=UPI00362029D0